MNGAFHQILSQLRKSMGVSQRTVASDLYISQALLSHYENGIREPGLDFVNRACDYYGVTADFLLGRTETNTADSPNPDLLPDAQTLISLLQATGQWEDETVAMGIRRCFGAVTYRLLRHLDTPDPKSLSVPPARAASLADLELCLGEIQFLDGLQRHPSPDVSVGPKQTLPRQLEAVLASLDRQISLHMQIKE